MEEDAKTVETSEACPTEDAIQALLEYLVDPLLPMKPPTRDVPSKDEQESVAKQVHAVVVLYNYYHRKKHPHLEHLSSEAFCKLAAVFRPILLLYLKDSRETERCNASRQASLIQQVITNACGLCKSLDALSDPQSVEKWPIGEVVVFLVNSDRKTCYLKHSLITQGVWSLIEKDVQTDKKNITTEDQPEGEAKDSEVVFEKLAFSAVEEATGVKQVAVTILERHVVYSLSKERTASCFYIMRCFFENSDISTVPIEDAINSLQGPLLQKSSSVWTTTPVVEYFHVLPYSDIVAHWFSRGEDDGFLEKQEAASISVAVEDDGRAKASEDHLTFEAADNGNESPQVAADGYKRVQGQEEAKSRRKTVFSNRGRPRKRVPSKLMGGAGKSCDDINDRYSPNNGLLGNNDIAVPKAIQHSDDHRENGTQKRKAVVEEPQNFADKLHTVHGPNSAADDARNSNLNLDKFQALILSKAKLLSETAMRVLLCKRDKLILQQRNVEDEIAKCDKSIQSILRGGEDDWELKLESVIECCNDAYPRRITETTFQQSPDNSACLSYKRLKLSEQFSRTKSSCQKLDDVCYENSWILPTYRVSSSDGGFKAKVRLKERDLEWSTHGDEKPNPEEARASAAACLLAKLHSTHKLWLPLGTKL